MSRSMTAAMAGAAAASVVRPAILGEFEFVSGTLRVWSGLGELSWNSQTWYGVYGLAAVAPVGETGDLASSGCRVTLNGIPGDLLTSVLTDTSQAGSATLYLALLNESQAVVADPVIKFKGYMDVPEIVDDGETCAVSVNVESRTRVLERSMRRTYTDADQQRDYPDDLGMQWAGHTGYLPLTSEWFKNLDYGILVDQV